MSLLQTLKRWSTGLALRIDALVMPGATPGHVLTVVSDGNGGTEVIPQAAGSSGTDLATLLTTNDDVPMRLGGVPARFATTTLGKALMAIVDAAAARTALGVQDGPRYIPLGGYVDVGATQGTRVIGGSPEALDPTAHAITGRTQTWTLILLASVVSGQTGTIELYDLTGASVAATISVTSATAGTAHTASVTLPGSARRYELRASCTGSTAAHYVTVLNTTIKQSWS